MCQKPLSIVVEGVLSKDTWAGRIYDEFAQTTTIGIDLKCQYEATTHQVEIETDLKTLADDVKGKLQLWLVEDSIVAPQMFPNNKVEKEYVHNHVFRDAINGEWGTELTLSTKNVHKEKNNFIHFLKESNQTSMIVGFLL